MVVPLPPNIDPLFASVEIEQDRASTPVGPPLMIPLPVTVIEPPVLKIGPDTVPEKVWGLRLHACAAPGAPSAAIAMSEAPASSAARERQAACGRQGTGLPLSSVGGRMPAPRLLISAARGRI